MGLGCQFHKFRVRSIKETMAAVNALETPRGDHYTKLFREHTGLQNSSATTTVNTAETFVL